MLSMVWRLLPLLKTEDMWYKSPWAIIGIAVVVIGVIWLLSWLFSSKERPEELPPGRLYEVRARGRTSRDNLVLTTDSKGELVLASPGTRRTAWSFPRVGGLGEGKYPLYNMQTGGKYVRMGNGQLVASDDTSSPPLAFELVRMGNYVLIRTRDRRYLTSTPLGEVELTDRVRDAIRFDIVNYAPTPS